MIHLIHCYKNFSKCHTVPPPSTTIKNKMPILKICKDMCYSLELNCPPEAHVLKAWSQAVALLEGGETFRR
jgi:hypothetical protein